MTKAKRHLLVSGGSYYQRTRAACGLQHPRHWTADPAEVTCGGCQKTLAMADAEVRKAQNNK